MFKALFKLMAFLCGGRIKKYVNTYSVLLVVYIYTYFTPLKIEVVVRDGNGEMVCLKIKKLFHTVYFMVHREVHFVEYLMQFSYHIQHHQQC